MTAEQKTQLKPFDFTNVHSTENEIKRIFRKIEMRSNTYQTSKKSNNSNLYKKLIDNRKMKESSYIQNKKFGASCSRNKKIKEIKTEELKNQKDLKSVNPIEFYQPELTNKKTNVRPQTAQSRSMSQNRFENLSGQIAKAYEVPVFSQESLGSNGVELLINENKLDNEQKHTEYIKESRRMVNEVAAVQSEVKPNQSDTSKIRNQQRYAKELESLARQNRRAFKETIIRVDESESLDSDDVQFEGIILTSDQIRQEAVLIAQQLCVFKEQPLYKRQDRKIFNRESASIDVEDNWFDLLENRRFKDYMQNPAILREVLFLIFPPIANQNQKKLFGKVSRQQLNYDLTECLKKMDKKQFQQLRDGQLSFDQVRAKVNAIYFDLHYKVLEDLKPILNANIYNCTEDPQNEIYYRKVFNVKDDKEIVPISEITKPKEPWQVNEKCLRSMFKKIKIVKPESYIDEDLKNQKKEMARRILDNYNSTKNHDLTYKDLDPDFFQEQKDVLIAAEKVVWLLNKNERNFCKTMTSENLKIENQFKTPESKAIITYIIKALKIDANKENQVEFAIRKINLVLNQLQLNLKNRHFTSNDTHLALNQTEKLKQFQLDALEEKKIMENLQFLRLRQNENEAIMKKQAHNDIMRMYGGLIEELSENNWKRQVMAPVVMSKETQKLFDIQDLSKKLNYMKSVGILSKKIETDVLVKQIIRQDLQKQELEQEKEKQQVFNKQNQSEREKEVADELKSNVMQFMGRTSKLRKSTSQKNYMRTNKTDMHKRATQMVNEANQVLDSLEENFKQQILVNSSKQARSIILGTNQQSSVYKYDVHQQRIGTGYMSKQPEEVGSMCEDVYQVKTPIPARIDALEPAAKFSQHLVDYQDTQIQQREYQTSPPQGRSDSVTISHNITQLKQRYQTNDFDSNIQNAGSRGPSQNQEMNSINKEKDKPRAVSAMNNIDKIFNENKNNESLINPQIINNNYENINGQSMFLQVRKGSISPNLTSTIKKVNKIESIRSAGSKLDEIISHEMLEMERERSTSNENDLQDQNSQRIINLIDKREQKSQGANTLRMNDSKENTKTLRLKSANNNINKLDEVLSSTEEYKPQSQKSADVQNKKFFNLQLKDLENQGLDIQKLEKILQMSFQANDLDDFINLKAQISPQEIEKWDTFARSNGLKDFQELIIMHKLYWKEIDEKQNKDQNLKSFIYKNKNEQKSYIFTEKPIKMKIGSTRSPLTERKIDPQPQVDIKPPQQFIPEYLDLYLDTDEKLHRKDSYKSNLINFVADNIDQGLLINQKEFSKIESKRNSAEQFGSLSRQSGVYSHKTRQMGVVNTSGIKLEQNKKSRNSNFFSKLTAGSGYRPQSSLVYAKSNNKSSIQNGALRYESDSNIETKTRPGTAKVNEQFRMTAATHETEPISPLPNHKLLKQNQSFHTQVFIQQQGKESIQTLNQTRNINSLNKDIKAASNAIYTKGNVLFKQSKIKNIPLQLNCKSQGYMSQSQASLALGKKMDLNTDLPVKAFPQHSNIVPVAKRNKHILESRMFTSGATLNEYKDNIQIGNHMHQLKKKNLYHFQGKSINTGISDGSLQQFSYPKQFESKANSIIQVRIDSGKQYVRHRSGKDKKANLLNNNNKYSAIESGMNSLESLMETEQSKIASRNQNYLNINQVYYGKSANQNNKNQLLEKMAKDDKIPDQISKLIQDYRSNQTLQDQRQKDKFNNISVPGLKLEVKDQGFQTSIHSVSDRNF